MLLIEFEENITYGLNILKYRNVKDDNWYYLYVDIETLNLLVSNFGIISTKRIPTQYICVDNYTTSKNIIMKFCNAPINIKCNNCINIFDSLTKLEQNF